MCMIVDPLYRAESSAYDAMVCCGAQHNTSVSALALRTALSDSTASFYARHYNAIALGCLPNYDDISAQLSSLVPATQAPIVK